MEELNIIEKTVIYAMSIIGPAYAYFSIKKGTIRLRYMGMKPDMVYQQKDAKSGYYTGLGIIIFGSVLAWLLILGIIT